jgi:hypothetical protein
VEVKCYEKESLGESTTNGSGTDFANSLQSACGVPGDVYRHNTSVNQGW